MTIQTDGINKDSYGNKEVQEGRLIYAADTASSDTYAVALQPAATAYVTGMTINFIATTANTGACTLNVNSLGVKDIKKLHDQALADNDIEAGQVVTVVYDGTAFQMQSQTAIQWAAGDGIDVTAAGVISTDLKANGGLVIETTELAVDLGASAITGTLAVGDGGTGATTVAGWDMSVPPIIGGTTPAAGYFSPTINKGPAITTFGDTTHQVSCAATTLTFEATADATLAGWRTSTSDSIVGTTIITGAIKQAAVTRYITAWTNSTVCTINSSATLAADTELVSVQLPIATFVNSAGVTQGWMNAAGRVVIGSAGASDPNIPIQVATSGGSTGGYFASNKGSDYGLLVGFVDTLNGLTGGQIRVVTTDPLYFITGNYPTPAMTILNNGNILTGGLTAAGTSAAKVLAMGTGTMPTALVADAVQMGVAEYNGATGDQRLNIYSEATVAKKTAIGSGTVSINGAVTTGGGFTRQLAEAASAALSGATGSIAVNVPAGARILGVQLRVDTEITSSDGGTTWTAVYVNTPTTAITSGELLTKSVVFKAVHPVYEITTGTVTITVSMNAGKLFSAGVIRAIVYYEAIDAMIAAP